MRKKERLAKKRYKRELKDRKRLEILVQPILNLVVGRLMASVAAQEVMRKALADYATYGRGEITDEQIRAIVEKDDAKDGC